MSGNCTTAIYVGHRGTDSKGAAMTSAYQIEQLNQYSFVNGFQSVRQGGSQEAWLRPGLHGTVQVL